MPERTRATIYETLRDGQRIATDGPCEFEVLRKVRNGQYRVAVHVEGYVTAKVVDGDGMKNV